MVARRFSKKFFSFFDWFMAKKTITPYKKRIARYMQDHPNATLAEARGHKPLIMYRTTLVLKLPVKKRWKIMRQQNWSATPLNTDTLIDGFIRKAGRFIHSKAYAEQESCAIGIEDNEEMPYNQDDIDTGEEYDEYDDGGT